MTTKRLIILLLTLGIGLSGVFFLPASALIEPVGIKLALPQFVGNWYGTDAKITDQELQILASDTQFARKHYTDATGGFVVASIVLSGHDLDNSIHRPERCLPAQGWTVINSRKLQILLPGGGELQVTRLHNVRQVVLADGKTVPIYNLNYYWFVGYHHVTASHLERTFLDIQDRMLKGYNQRWAYVAITSDITKGLIPFGRSESEVDAMLQEFIRNVVPQISQPNENPAVAQRPERQAKLASL